MENGEQKKNLIDKLNVDYIRKKEEIGKETRREYLRAIDEESDRWVDSPDECRFLRFKFKEGITYPYNIDPDEKNEKRNKIK